jgi:Flp pilus assembly protein TadG
MNRLRGQRGQTAVEFALCATVFFMLVFGLLKVATIYGDYVALQHAARDGARKGSVTRGTGDADPATVRAAVITAAKGSGTFLDPSQMSFPNTFDSTCPACTSWKAHDVLEVTVTYPWTLDVLGLPVWSGTMSTTTQVIIE